MVEEVGMSKKSMIGIGWKEYCRFSIPDDVSAVQLHETRKAFFFGAATMFYGQLAIFQDGEEATERDLAIRDDVHNELDAFIDEMEVEGESFERTVRAARRGMN